MTAQARTQIVWDIARWVEENDGMPGVLRFDAPRLKGIVDDLLAEGPGLTSTTVWYLITMDGTDVALINRRLKEMRP
jgi:hypothetical protein